MKRKFGVLAILLPLPNPKKPFPLPYPLMEGDRLQTSMLQQLVKAAPATLPLSHLVGKKLILNLFSMPGGTHISVFPTLENAMTLPHGRVHPVLVTARPPERMDIFLGSDSSSIDLELPLIGEEKCLKTLCAHADKPHLLSISPSGEVLAITEGYYISTENIRKASGLKPSKRISLV